MISADSGRFLRRAATVIGLVALAIAIVLAAWRVADLILLAFAGVLLAVFLRALATPIMRHTPLPSRLALAVVVLGLFAVIGAAGAWIGPRLGTQAQRLQERWPRAQKQVEQYLSRSGWGRAILRELPFLQLPPPGAAKPQPGAARPPPGAAMPPPGAVPPPSRQPPAGQRGAAARPPTFRLTPAPPGRLRLNLGAPPRAPPPAFAPRSPQPQGGWEFGQLDLLSEVTRAFSATVGVVAKLVFLLFMSLFFAADPDTYLRGLIKLVPTDKRQRAGEVLETVGKTLKDWLVGQVVSMAIIGLMTGLTMWILGVPLALMLGFIAFALEFIPIAGPILSAVPAVMLAFLQGPSKVLVVIIAYVLIQQLEGNLILPVVQKKAVHLPPALTLAALFVMGALFGFFGLLVATPTVAVLLVVVRMVYVEGVLGEPQMIEEVPAGDEEV